MHPVLGLHHVTATVDAAQDDLDFAVGTLGLRLVKRTVNFDNHHVFHFYYGDERGTPGTLWTTFPYQGHGVREGRKGNGQVTATAFSVPRGELDYWRQRLGRAGIASSDIEDRFGDAVVACSDSSGLDFELIGSRHDHRKPWVADSLDPAVAIRGLHSVTLTVKSAEPTVDFLTHVLGLHVVDRQGPRTRLAAHAAGPGRLIDVLEHPQGSDAVNGIGTVHHVALAVETAEQQRAMRAAIHDAGGRVTEVRDRCYFTSIYFREPGGVLIEIATTGPGFLVDEPLESLGGALQLPPWEEASRAAIERGLPAIVVP